MPIPESSKYNNIQVISRAADILRLLARDTGGLSLGQIANEAGLPRSTVQRIVAALSAEGLVSTGTGNGGIRLGPEVQRLARAVGMTPRDRFRPVMEDLAKATGETVDLAVLRGDKMLFVDQIVGSQRLRTVSSVGESFPLTTTANGKAALSCMDEVEATNLILSEIRGQTRKGSLTDFLAEIEEVRGGALARDMGEHTDGISALGFGFVDATGEVLAVSVPVPSSRFALKEETLIAAISSARDHLEQG